MINLVASTKNGFSFVGPLVSPGFMTLTGLTIGDLVVACIGVHSTVVGEIVTPPGWTVLNSAVALLIHPQTMFVKKAAAATEVFDLTLTRYLVATSNVVGAMAAYDGLGIQHQIVASSVSTAIAKPIAPGAPYDLQPSMGGRLAPAGGMLLNFLGYSTYNGGYGDFGFAPTITLPPAYPGLTEQQAEQLAESSVMMRFYDAPIVSAGLLPVDEFSIADTNTNLSVPGQAQSVLGQIVLQPAVFVGTPVVEQIADNIVRVTGLRLDPETTGTIGLAQRIIPAEITLSAGFQPQPALYDNVLIDLIAGIDVTVKCTSIGGNTVDVPIYIVKTGGTPQTWTAAITNPHATLQTNDLEIYVKFHS